MTKAATDGPMPIVMPESAAHTGRILGAMRVAGTLRDTPHGTHSGLSPLVITSESRRQLEAAGAKRARRASRLAR